VRIFHIATATDWAAARRSGAYTTSTRGVTLEQEGFIHAARREQVQPVWRRYYADAGEPLVLLTIDTDKLASPWREDPVASGGYSDTYPHVYGPIHPSAVVRVQPLDSSGTTGSFAILFAREMGLRMALVLGAMLLAGVGTAIGSRTSSDWGPFVGGVAGLVVGLALVAVILRRRG
jgi:uncharacterized protein (DUF952 family)